MSDKVENIDESEISKTLLNDLSTNRSSLYDMLDTLKEFRNNTDKLFPKKMDYKSRYMVEQNMNTVTQIYNVELSIRKHLDDSIKTEINLREKFDVNDPIDERAYIEKIALAIEKIKEK